MIKKVLTLLFALVVITTMIALPSCGNASSTTSTTSTSSNPSTPSSTPTLPQVLRINLGGEPSQIDPNRASWANEVTIVHSCFEGLLYYNNSDLSLKTVGATEIPTVDNGGISSDGLTYTFKLNPKVTWSDGQKVTAKDYEYSLKRLFDPDLAADYTSFYFNIVGGEDYYSATNATTEQKNQLRDAVGVKALDDYTLQIKLTSPLPTFLQLMALWPAYPVRQDIIEKYGDKWTEAGTYIGNGPFMMKEWVHSDHITLVKNPNYWGTTAKLDEIDIKMITDANAAYAAYQNNELDISGVPAGTEKTVMADPVLSKQILRYPQLVTFAFQFNVTTGAFR